MPPLNPNSEVAGGGGADEALSECTVLGRNYCLLSSRENSPTAHHPAWLRPGRPFSASAAVSRGRRRKRRVCHVYNQVDTLILKEFVHNLTLFLTPAP